MRRKTVGLAIRDVIGITVGCIIYALSFALFVIPRNLAPGGISGLAIVINHFFGRVPIGDALDRDRRGRPLPVWQGCRRIAYGDIFLMNPDVHDSLDGRYFGPIPTRDVIGKATPLYTDEDGDGRFVWRAATR